MNQRDAYIAACNHATASEQTRIRKAADQVPILENQIHIIQQTLEQMQQQIQQLMQQNAQLQAQLKTQNSSESTSSKST